MKIIRKYKEDRTEGKIIFPDDSFIFCLERSWEGNKPNISCVPEGVYLVDRDKKGRFRLYKIREGQIPTRTDIEFHAGNNALLHSNGCILPCMFIKNGLGVSSIEACNKILDWYQDDSFVLEIVKYNPIKHGKWKD